jgi:hypothetical protein
MLKQKPLSKQSIPQAVYENNLSNKPAMLHIKPLLEIAKQTAMTIKKNNIGKQ